MSEWTNPCYRARRGIAHAPHMWTNGIEVQYAVQCPGSTTTDRPSAKEQP